MVTTIGVVATSVVIVVVVVAPEGDVVAKHANFFVRSDRSRWSFVVVNIASIGAVAVVLVVVIAVGVSIALTVSGIIAGTIVAGIVAGIAIAGIGEVRLVTVGGVSFVVRST